MEAANFKLYSVANIRCSKACSFEDAAGRPLYFDNAHLTLTGAKKLTNLFENIIGVSWFFQDQQNWNIRQNFLLELDMA